MDGVNSWVGAVVGILAILGAGVASARWMAGWFLRKARVMIREVVTEVVHEVVDPRFESLEPRFASIDARLNRIDARFDGIERRLDGIDSRIVLLESRTASGFTLVDVRLSALEGDMTLVKQHLLGTAA